ncbi:hypothetical protein ES708_09897 [subsurface metagenome]
MKRLLKFNSKLVPGCHNLLRIVFTLIIITSEFSVSAKVKLPSVFSDKMVLQQKSIATIWGWADAGEKILITTSWGKKAEIVANTNGNWTVKISTPSGSYSPQQITIKGENEIILKNILIGEVWLCSGQSNMGWSVSQSNNADEEIANAKYPNIRFFHVPNTMAWEPQTDVNAEWQVCSPETVAKKSAAAYFFGRNLFQELNVPIGLIVSAWGGSDVQAWIDRRNASKLGFQNIVDWYDQHESSFKKLRAEWMEGINKWKTQQKEGEKPDWSTRPKRMLPGDNHIPFALYNGMIHPIKPYIIKGAIWYQGETNVPRANQYRTLFPAFIQSWRNVWQQGNFPFYYVQIAPFHYRDSLGVTSAELRDAQLKTLDLVKNTGMVVTTDIGNALDIHPRKKQDVGYRLALLALHDYGKLDHGFSSPLYESKKVSGNSLIIDFKYAKELKTKRGNEIIGLTIAGKDQKFVKAKAEIINGNRLKVWSDDVKKPVAVRYGWSNAPFVNLVNEVNLPVSPFKTDSWEDTTEGNIHLDFP